MNCVDETYRRMVRFYTRFVCRVVVFIRGRDSGNCFEWRGNWQNFGHEWILVFFYCDIMESFRRVTNEPSVSKFKTYKPPMAILLTYSAPMDWCYWDEVSSADLLSCLSPMILRKTLGVVLSFDILSRFFSLLYFRQKCIPHRWNVVVLPRKQCPRCVNKMPSRTRQIYCVFVGLLLICERKCLERYGHCLMVITKMSFVIR